MFRILILLLIIGLSSISCERTGQPPESSPDLAATDKKPILTHLDHLRGQEFTALNGSMSSTCTVRDERRFSACPECFIACLQSSDAPPPSGLYLGNSPALNDFPRLSAYGDSLFVEDQMVVDLQDGEIHSDQISSGLLIEPLFAELQDLAGVHQAQAEVMGETVDPTLYVLVNPDHPWRLMLQILYTTSQAGLEPVLLHKRDEDITRLSIGCRGSEGDETSFENNEKRGEEFPGVTYLCMLEEEGR